VVRVFRYRLYPTRAQDSALRETLWRLRELYNAALEERTGAYRKQGVSLSGYTQMAELREVRALLPEYAAIHVHLLQDAITRLDRAYRSFFRRAKAKQTAGFPRFQGRGRYTSFTFKDAANRNGGDGHWYACMCCNDVPAKPLPATGASVGIDVGIDVGITTFAALSNGELVANPRYYEQAQASLRRAQKTVSRRRNKRSNRRRKAVALLAKQHDLRRRSNTA